MPSFETNCIEDWELKLDQIVAETINQDMTLISGIPPWMQMYFDRLVEKSGKKVGELFPNFSVMVQGGVNYEPYKSKLIETIGRNIDTIELFPASEGFFAFQDSLNTQGMLLNTNSGIFFEFIPVSEIGNENPTRLMLKDVELGVNYALIISSNAGLWAYSIGDTVKFVSLEPYRIIVSGRIKHFISAFGEHVIGEEVESAMLSACAAMDVKLIEFTVAPFVSSDDAKSFHEWFVEFEHEPADLNAFALLIDDHLRKKNVYYDDFIIGNILDRLKISVVQKNGFVDFMKSIGKLGGQNKVPRLSNDRKIAEGLQGFVLK
jgi:acyl-CoA synthetase (AMP-forming)/AMP-acid ligase II